MLYQIVQNVDKVDDIHFAEVNLAGGRQTEYYR